MLQPDELVVYCRFGTEYAARVCAPDPARPCYLSQDAVLIQVLHDVVTGRAHYPGWTGYVHETELITGPAATAKVVSWKMGVPRG